MPANDKTQNTLITHAVLTGLTPLIPIPFVDDMVYMHFLRSMVQQLGTERGAILTPEVVQALTAQRRGGCPLGCVVNLLLFPLKYIFRKFFFFIELKRMADIISRTYYFGFLIDTALRDGQITAETVPNIRAAIDRVLARTNTSLVNRAVFAVVKESKGILKTAGELLASRLRSTGGAPREADVAREVAAVEGEEKQQVSGVIAQLQAAIAGMPVEHFEQLREELWRELG